MLVDRIAFTQCFSGIVHLPSEKLDVQLKHTFTEGSTKVATFVSQLETYQLTFVREEFLSTTAYIDPTSKERYIY